MQEILELLFELPWYTTHRVGWSTPAAPTAQTPDPPTPPAHTHIHTHTHWPPLPEFQGNKSPQGILLQVGLEEEEALASPKNALLHLLSRANSYSDFMAPAHTPILGRPLWAALGDRIRVFVPALVAGLRVNLILRDSKLPEVCGLGLNRYHV